jgi:hypothetical protein
VKYLGISLQIAAYVMNKNASRKWEARELIPFLQHVLAHRVSKPGVGRRVWDEACNRVVQSARHQVRRADVQDYSKTPYTVVNRLFLALVNHNPYSPDHSALASMTVESCAIVFIQQAKTYGPYPLYSRIGAWMTPEWWSVIEWEEATERRSQQQRHTVDHKER